jgi:hypothetical protein
LTAGRRREIAQDAANARWGGHQATPAKRKARRRAGA